MAYLPSDRFKVADVDDADNAYPRYYGYVSKLGDWEIVKENKSGTVVSYTLARGIEDYTTNWTNRASLTYARWDNL